ncbi:hypothetical protein BGZ60DRAFT_396942 [Tricladium varicosporioides]|nr:hypothetical protein BGZ60DRAFT_396942 [Hymenoscyphus varicosporioides]
MERRKAIKKFKDRAKSAASAAVVVFSCIVCPCVLCAVAVWNHPVGKCGTPTIQRAKRARDKRIRKERLANEPAPLRLPRRALSISEPSQSRISKILHLPSFISKSTKPSVTGFFSLPFDIRERIYKEVLGNGLLHLTQLPKRLGHFRCKYEDGNAKQGEQRSRFYDHLRECIDPVHNLRCPHSNSGETTVRKYLALEPLDIWGESDGCIALLQVCRQIYREGIFILYTTNTFEVNHAQTLIFLARTIPIQRLEIIQTLQVTWNMSSRESTRELLYPDDTKTWEVMWDIVGTKMKGLQRVKLTMLLLENISWNWASRTFPVRELIARKLLEPSRKVRGLIEFQLDIKSQMTPNLELEIEQLREMVRDTTLTV